MLSPPSQERGGLQGEDWLADAGESGTAVLNWERGQAPGRQPVPVVDLW